MSQQRMLIIGNQPIIAESLSVSLAQCTSFEVVTCQDIDNVASQLASLQPHLVVIILNQSTTADDLAVFWEISLSVFEPRIIVLAPQSLTNNERFLLELIRVGANAVLTWEELTLSQFATVLENVSHGQNVFDMRKLRLAITTYHEATQQPSWGFLH
jgi:DNA-binding NarL/FixJ family response regulator